MVMTRDIREDLGVESLLLHVERNQLRRRGLLGRLLDASLERSSGHVPTEGDPEEDPEHGERDEGLSSDLGTPQGPTR